MILNGKAKEYFLNWVGLTEDMFLCSHSEREIEYMQIEWLDSVGIYISVVNEYFNSFRWVIGDNIDVIDASSLELNETRQEATKQAIIRANEIYNNR